jgi:hypothetical protein
MSKLFERMGNLLERIKIEKEATICLRDLEIREEMQILYTSEPEVRSNLKKELLVNL